MSDHGQTPPDLARERRANDVLAAALERPASDRRAWVAAECGDDAALCERVLHLLRLTTDDAGHLETGAALLGESARRAFGDDAGDDDELIGRRAGAYRLGRPLGRGGFATVYLGERADGAFDSTVAVKILHTPAGGAEDVVRRFEQERRILATLTHEHVARLIDGGTTDWGRPFVVVEHVDGEPIDRYCASRELSLDRRLRLVLDVVDAVDHAHRRLVVHRDIKPSNILVDDAGRVKLLDFGIAKLLEPVGDAGDAPVTRTAAMVLTPRYASPEQLLGEPVTTATDVYQLGVLLHELLTGRPAFASPGLAPAELVDSARTRASLQPSALSPSPELRGDLDAIVMMATRPEPDRRYPSAARLADDLRAYLDGRPVQARGDSLGYRVRKFVGRNRLAVAIAAVLTLAAAASAVGIAWGFVRAEGERRRAEAVSAFLKDTLRGAQPHIALGRDTTLLEAVVDDAAARIDDELAGQSYAAAELRETVAQTYRMLSRYDDALAHATVASGSYTELLGPDAPQTLNARNLLALIHWDLGDFETAESIVADAYRRAPGVLAADDPIAIDIVTNMGVVTRALGRPAEAEPYYRETLERCRRSFGDEDPRTISAISNLAFLLQELDRLDEAEALAREAADLGRAHLGPDNSDTWLHVDKLASLISERGRPEEALPLHLEACAGMETTLGPRHSTTLGCSYNLARVQRRLGRHDDALATIDAMVPVLIEEFGAESRYVLFTRLERGRTLLAAGRASEATPTLRDVAGLADGILPADHYQRALIDVSLAEALVESGRSAAAEPLLREARGLLEATFGADGTHRHFEELRRVEAKLP